MFVKIKNRWWNLKLLVGACFILTAGSVFAHEEQEIDIIRLTRGMSDVRIERKNPKKLFHMTRPQNVESIKKHGFRVLDEGHIDSFALGRGVYFCKNPKDCERLALNSGAILKADVNLGICLIIETKQAYNELHRRLTRNGYGGVSKLRANRINIDSIWWNKSDSPRNEPSEIIIYNPDSIKNIRG